MRAKPLLATQSEVWNEIDHRLVSLKVAQAASQLADETEEKQRQIRLRNRNNANTLAVPLAISRLQLERTRKWSDRVYEICCEVWEAQGRTKTPEFVRVVLNREIAPIFETAADNIVFAVRQAAGPGLAEGDTWLTGLHQELKRETGRLMGTFATKIEIEALELEHKRNMEGEHGRGEKQRFNYSFRPHQSFAEFLSCVAVLAGQEKLEAMRRGPSAEHLWMLGPGLPELSEFKSSDGIEALRNVWERVDELRAGGKGAVQDVLAACLQGKFPEDNSGILAGAVWSCVLLHGDKSEPRERPKFPALKRDAKRRKTEESNGEDTSRRIEPFTHSEDYHSVTVRGEHCSLTSRQAQIVEILHRAHESGNPEVGVDYILEKLETPNGRWQDTFKSSPAAKKALIRTGTKRGTLRLNL